MVARVGQDVFGEQSVRNYQEHGIDTAHILRDADRPTGVASIVVDDAGQNCILLVAGANQGLSPEDVRAAASTIEGASVLLAQLEVPLETTWEAFRLARAAGVRTILNPAPAVPLPDELLRLTDLCIPNEIEAELLTGQRVTTVEEAEKAACALGARAGRGAGDAGTARGADWGRAGGEACAGCVSARGGRIGSRRCLYRQSRPLPH